MEQKVQPLLTLETEEPGQGSKLRRKCWEQNGNYIGQVQQTKEEKEMVTKLEILEIKPLYL